MTPELTTALDDLSTHHRSGKFYNALLTFAQEVGEPVAKDCLYQLVGALWHHYAQKGYPVRITDHAQRAAMKRLLVISPGLGRLFSMAGATMVGRTLPPDDRAEVKAFIEAKLGNLHPEPRRSAGPGRRGGR
jgi:hypothetical protein